jgi:hypothetical protein
MSRNRLFRAVPARAFALAAIVAMLVLAAAPAAAQCPVTPGVDWVNVELMDPPAPGPDLSSHQAEIMRREHVHLSSILADMLALDDLVDSDPFAPNPQVRVVIESPDVFDAKDDARLSFGIFTVTGIFESQDVRLRVYERDATNDKNSGEFKLFADENGSVRTFSAHSGGFLAGALIGVSARVIGIPVSSSLVDGGSSNDPLYCEAASSTYFEEEAVIAAGADVVLTAPHGKNVEVKTSDQLGVVEDQLAADGVVANVWDVRGGFGLGQTFQRLHVTAPSIYPDSFPGLRQLMAKTDWATGIPFRFAVALHGYTSSQKGIILGGQADREAKCLVAARIRDELAAARGNAGEIGFRIVDDADGDLTVASSTGHVPPDDHGGQSDDNIVNRLSPNAAGLPGWGGIQIEQSSAVRDDTTNPGGQSPSSDGWLRNVVSRGLAQAMVELLAFDGDDGPTGACSSL